MNTKQAALVQHSWNQVRSVNAGKFSQIFLQCLLKQEPAHTIDVPGKWMQFLNAMIERVNEPGMAIQQIGQYAQRRLKHHLQPGDCLYAGNALLFSLAITLSDHWNEELRDAWAGYCTLISNTIIEAAFTATASEAA